jgi:hypothetical protein
MLLGKPFYQSKLIVKLLNDNSEEEDPDGEDAVKFKKQDYLHDANTDINQHWQELLLRFPVKFKIGQISDHICEILIPPPNTAI